MAAELPLRNINELSDEGGIYLETPALLQSNDPSLTELILGTYDDEFVPNDWALAGDCIGKNTHLEDLSIDLPKESVTEAQFQALCRGLAHNRSIQKVTVLQHPFNGREYNMMLPFFQNNPSLLGLVIGDNCIDAEADRESTEVLAYILQKFGTNNSLVFFSFNGRGIGGEVAAHLFQALEGHSELKHLYLYGGNLRDGEEIMLGRDGTAALMALLQKDGLECIELHGNVIDDEGAAIFAVTLAGNITMEELTINRNTSIRTTGWMALSALLRSKQLRMKNISIGTNLITDDVLTSMAASLAKNKHVKRLDLAACNHFSSTNNITISGWRALFGYLKSPRCVLSHLDISENNINDAAIASLVSSLMENCKLKKLNLSGNSITKEGLHSFLAVLQSQKSALDDLDLSYLGVTDETAIRYADELSTNNKLKRISFFDTDQAITSTGLASFSRVLCDKSSIMNTFLSNHTLESVEHWDSWGPTDELAMLLKINQTNNNSDAARLKIIKAHFSGNDSKLQSLIGLPLEVLPHIIHWIGRGSSNSTENRDNNVGRLMYQFIRARPTLVQEGKNNLKRKRQHEAPTFLDKWLGLR